MREVTTNLGHVRPPLGCAVKVDDGVTVLHQVGPVDGLPGELLTRLVTRNWQLNPPIRKIPRLHSVSWKVNNGDDPKGSSEAIRVKWLPSSVKALLSKCVQAEGPVNCLVNPPMMVMHGLAAAVDDGDWNRPHPQGSHSTTASEWCEECDFDRFRLNRMSPEDGPNQGGPRFGAPSWPHRWLYGAFGQLMGHEPSGRFLLPSRHGFGKVHPFFPQGKNHQSGGV